MKEPLQGCGIEEGPLTLYRLADDLPPIALGGDYWHIRCGYRPPTRIHNARGILLCEACVAKLGLLPYRQPDLV